MLDEQLIDRYLTKKHTLTTQEIEFIETRIASDKQFKKEVLIQLELIENINKTFEQELKSKLQKFKGIS